MDPSMPKYMKTYWVVPKTRRPLIIVMFDRLDFNWGMTVDPDSKKTIIVTAAELGKNGWVQVG